MDLFSKNTVAFFMYIAFLIILYGAYKYIVGVHEGAKGKKGRQKSIRKKKKCNKLNKKLKKFNKKERKLVGKTKNPNKKRRIDKLRKKITDKMCKVGCRQLDKKGIVCCPPGYESVTELDKIKSRATHIIQISADKAAQYGVPPILSHSDFLEFNTEITRIVLNNNPECVPIHFYDTYKELLDIYLDIIEKISSNGELMSEYARLQKAAAADQDDDEDDDDVTGDFMDKHFGAQVKRVTALFSIISMYTPLEEEED